jgi:hypothetical protein
LQNACSAVNAKIERLTVETQEGIEEEPIIVLSVLCASTVKVCFFLSHDFDKQ